jgi:hypothetical protein
MIDTDTLANNDPTTNLVVHAFRYKDDGKHEKVSTWNLTYQQIKESSKSFQPLKVMNEDSNAYLEFD